MDINTGREFPFVNPQDDPGHYPQPPPDLRTHQHPYKHPHPDFTMNDSYTATLEAHVYTLRAELERAKAYIIRLGGTWPNERVSELTFAVPPGKNIPKSGER